MPGSTATSTVPGVVPVPVENSQEGAASTDTEYAIGVPELVTENDWGDGLDPDSV